MPVSHVTAERLRLAAARKNWNATDLARATKRDPRTVGNWWNGETQPRADDIIACATALDVSADYLLGLADHPSGLRIGCWVLDLDLLDLARKPGNEVNPAFRIPVRPQLVTDAEMRRIATDVAKERGA